MTTLTIGTRVRFTRSFLRSTGQYAGPEGPTSVGPWARGVIVHRPFCARWNGRGFSPEIIGSPFVSVRWADGRTGSVHTGNLEACK